MSAYTERPLVPSGTVIVAHLDGESVLLDLDSKHYYRLNDSGAAIWRALESGAELAAIAPMLVATFDVSETEAAAAVGQLLGDLASKGLLRPRAVE